MQDRAKIAHLPLFDLAFMLKACRASDYRRNMFALAEATANVLTDEHLTIVDLRARLTSEGELFRVNLGDLNEEGFTFAGKGYQRWLANTDRWKNGRPLAKLEAALRKQVAAHRRTSG